MVVGSVWLFGLFWLFCLGLVFSLIAFDMMLVVIVGGCLRYSV